MNKPTNNYKEIFHTATTEWFEHALGTPTDVQAEAWPAVASGKHVLISAPTGTGKTLSAFLVYIDQMITKAREGTLPQGLQVVYISPLKSLAGDIRENLYRPLIGIVVGGSFARTHHGSVSKQQRLEVEGDLIAGELSVPLEWFEILAEQGRCLYIEPGLWIAAEHEAIYKAALEEGEPEARRNVVRRALRYRGAMDLEELAERYFWPRAAAQAVKH